jgi:hypothetical protein
MDPLALEMVPGMEGLADAPLVDDQGYGTGFSSLV